MKPTATRYRPGWCGLILAGVGLATGSALHAAQWHLSPVRLYLPPEKRVAVVEVHNLDEAPVVIQAIERSWRQDGEGRDQYEPSDALVISPPLFELASGATQVVRVGLRGGADAAIEEAYRIFFSEVRKAQPSSSGVAVALRLAVPVFVEPASGVRPNVRWSLENGADAPVLLLRNTGNLHVQVAELVLRDPTTQRVLARVTRPGYALAGTDQRFVLESVEGLGAWAGRSVKLEAETDRGPLDAQVEVPLWSDSSGEPQSN